MRYRKKIGIFLFVGLTMVVFGCNNRKEKAEAVKQADTIPVQPEKLSDSLNPLDAALKTFSSDTIFRHATVSYCFLDASNDSILAAYNADQSLVPASTMKLFTTAAALEILKPGTHFSTSLQYEGIIRNKTLYGNIILKGGGDPTFCLNEEKFNHTFSNWCTAIRNLGIDSIQGSVIGDGRIFSRSFIPYTWAWGEIHMGYCAPASGLSVFGNVYQLLLYPSKNGQRNWIVKESSPIQLDEIYDTRITESASDKEDIYLIGHPLSSDKMIMGSIPKGKAEALLIASINNPPLAAATAFLGWLRDQGIYVSGNAISAADSDSLKTRLANASVVNITSVFSPSVSSLVYTTNQVSYNFFAESLLKHIGLRIYKNGGTASGALAVRNHWISKGMNPGGFAMFDGSGISRFNTVTANQLTWLLKYMQNSPAAKDFKASLATSGISGTLRKMPVDTASIGRVSAKSGTMSRIRSYAGYAETKSGKTIIFAIMVNYFEGTSLELKEKIGKIMDAMVQM